MNLSAMVVAVVIVADGQDVDSTTITIWKLEGFNFPSKSTAKSTVQDVLVFLLFSSFAN